MSRQRTRREGERVHWQGKIRFFGGWERSLLHDVDGFAIIREIVEKRVKEKKFTGDMSVDKIIDGHKIRFTQKQTRALLLHVKEVKDGEV